MRVGVRNEAGAVPAVMLMHDGPEDKAVLLALQNAARWGSGLIVTWRHSGHGAALELSPRPDADPPRDAAQERPEQAAPRQQVADPTPVPGLALLDVDGESQPVAVSWGAVECVLPVGATASNVVLRTGRNIAVQWPVRDVHAALARAAKVWA